MAVHAAVGFAAHAGARDEAELGLDVAHLVTARQIKPTGPSVRVNCVLSGGWKNMLVEM